MIKIEYNKIDLGGPTPNLAFSVAKIESDEEVVTIPKNACVDNDSLWVRRIGFIKTVTVDNRSDYEKWKDEYYYNYYPTPSLNAVEVPVSKSVKKIIISGEVEKISTMAFKNLKDVVFEIDQNNRYYEIKDGKIVEKKTGEIIWPHK